MSPCHIDISLWWEKVDMIITLYYTEGLIFMVISYHILYHVNV